MLWNLSECTCTSPLAQPLPKREGHPHHPARSFFPPNDESWNISMGSTQKVKEAVGGFSQAKAGWSVDKDVSITQLPHTWKAPLTGTPSALPVAFLSPHSHMQGPVSLASFLSASCILFFSFPHSLGKLESDVFPFLKEPGVVNL